MPRVNLIFSGDDKANDNVIDVFNRHDALEPVVEFLDTLLVSCMQELVPSDRQLHESAKAGRMGEPRSQIERLKAERSCGACTACCDGWLQIEVRGHPVRPGKPCPFRIDHGCSIYGERPQHPCREFVCGWLVASSPLPDWMRPDRSDMIMLAANFAWQGLPVDVIVAVGKQPKAKALAWLMKFSAKNRRCLIYQIGEDWFAFGPPAFQREISERIGRGEKPWAE